MLTWRGPRPPGPGTLTCAICGVQIELEAASQPRGGSRSVVSHPEVEAHLLRHSPAERMQAAFRAVLPHIPPNQRPAAALAFYRGLRPLLDARDRQGVFGIEEALGSARLYRLWLDANRTPSAQPVRPAAPGRRADWRDDPTLSLSRARGRPSSPGQAC
jgi:hypothetical protein